MIAAQARSSPRRLGDEYNGIMLHGSYFDNQECWCVAFTAGFRDTNEVSSRSHTGTTWVSRIETGNLS